MVEFLKALLLGFVEGMTEFIPVSSTAHLLILTNALDFSGPPGHVFEIFIQLGAILAVVVLYQNKIFYTFRTYFSETASRSLLNAIVLATIPALIVGYFGHDFIKEHFYNPLVIGFTLISGGGIILLAEELRPRPNVANVNDISLKAALCIGLCQMIALIPGVSRSGASIIGGLLMKLERPVAAEFSFFLAIPVMFAAVGYDTLKNWHDIMEGGYWGVMITGFLAAFVTALFVVKVSLHIINRFGFKPFAWYRIAAGICVLFFVL